MPDNDIACAHAPAQTPVVARPFPKAAVKMVTARLRGIPHASRRRTCVHACYWELEDVRARWSGIVVFRAVRCLAWVSAVGRDLGVESCRGFVDYVRITHAPRTLQLPDR